MTVRKMRDGQKTSESESHYCMDEGDIFPINIKLDKNGILIPYIITGSDLIENLDAGGINVYIFSEKHNSWNKI